MISKHKSGRYYYCEVSNVEQELFCKVLFDDGSLSTNLYPEDFQVIFIVTFLPDWVKTLIFCDIIVFHVLFFSLAFNIHSLQVSVLDKTSVENVVE